MIHYHGTPISGQRDATARFLVGRHALVPWGRQDDLDLVIEHSSSFVVDNSAFSAWTRGAEVNWDEYYLWVSGLLHLPNFDWAIIPDVIGGTEGENDELLLEWPRHLPGVPVWHSNESVERFVRLCDEWPRVAIGAHPNLYPGTDGWWQVLGRAMDAITDPAGRVTGGTRLHGLRMLNPALFRHLPLSSADSANAARNANNTENVAASPSRLVRLSVIASRTESYNAAPVWQRINQQDLFTQCLAS